LGLMHLSQSYVPDRFPPDSQEEYMPAPRRPARKVSKARPPKRKRSTGEFSETGSTTRKPSFKISKKLSSKAGKRTTARSFSETGYKAPSAVAKKKWAFKKAISRKPTTGTLSETGTPGGLFGKPWLSSPKGKTAPRHRYGQALPKRQPRRKK